VEKQHKGLPPPVAQSCGFRAQKNKSPFACFSALMIHERNFSVVLRAMCNALLCSATRKAHAFRPVSEPDRKTAEKTGFSAVFAEKLRRSGGSYTQFLPGLAA
jgi:hypothetical protein